MPTTVFETESTLTDRYQTTVPEPVRRALKLGKRDKVHYTIQSDGSVLLSRVIVPIEDEPDPVLGKFLQFLANDIEQNPHRLQPISAELMARIERLTANVDADLDLNAPLPPDDDEDE
jgi:antitoxin PrlF